MLGFKNEGGTWYLPDDPSVVVEFTPGPLDGSWDRLETVSGPGGTEVKVISIEDIIIDRASGVKHRNDSDEWVKYMMVGHDDDIDWEYLNQRAEELDCKEVIDESRKWAKEQRDQFLDE